MWAYLGLIILASGLTHVRTAVVVGKADNIVANNIETDNIESSRSVSPGLFSDFRYVYQVYEECKNENFATCLKMKLVTTLDSAVRSVRRISLLEGVALVRDDDPSVMAAPPVTREQLDSSLPRALDQRDDTLDALIFDKLMQVFHTHSLQFKLLDDNSARSFGWEAEGARKRKGLNSLLLVAMLLGGTMIPLKFGALALLAGKALIISKLALALALIVGLKKLVGGGGGHETSYQVVTVPGHGHGASHYKRSIHETQADASDMAYAYYDPKLQH
ncbi:uncharacterized protein LOC111043593 [Nilaparvata lugens]|uniref:uncharacterized protein LOC111043593 n=1 Tax=Nilaparvata lugens TaxID=108931 RepID=UPI00193D7966|nr:uncharacterized protein LOC111043593 [Nilaparvata lugens]